MQLRSRMIRTCETSASKAGCLHAEIATVLLDEQVRRDLGNSEQAMQRLVNRHSLRNSRGRVWVARVEIPTGILLDQRQRVWPISIYFVRRHVDENRVRRITSRRLQQNGGSVRIDGEIDGRIGRGPVMGGLRCSMNDQGK